MEHYLIRTFPVGHSRAQLSSRSPLPERPDWLLSASAEGALEVFVRRPSGYVSRHLRQILPAWSARETRTLLVLQRAQVSLVPATPLVEAEKARLRDRFLAFARSVVEPLHARQIAAEAIDPQTGRPLFGPSGNLTHDDVMAVAALLGYAVVSGPCQYLEHPEWGTAVYPGALFVAAELSELRAIFPEAGAQLVLRDRAED